METQLVGRDAAADADLGPAVAQMIEDGDLLDHAQRRVQRQQIDHRAHANAFGRARDGAQENSRRRHRVRRRHVMLGEVVREEPGLVGRRDE